MIRSKTSRGFSLVELMVALTLSLILVAGALSVLFTSRITYFQNERTGRMQEGGRVAIELMLRDMRASGFRGCTQYVPSVTNALPTPTGLLWNFASPVQGFEADPTKSTWSPTLDSEIDGALAGSDVIAVRTTLSDSPVFSLNAPMDGTNADLSVDRLESDSVEKGDSMAVSDCSGTAVFAVSSFTGSGTTATIATGGAELEKAFGAGAQVTPVDTVIYYVAPSTIERPGGVRNPALWRKVGASDPQELVEGVELMQALYGVDTDNDRLVNSYLPADEVTNWSNVLSVNIAMLVRSTEPNADIVDNKTYTVLGTSFGPKNDRYQRQMYSTTVALRNNMQ